MPALLRVHPSSRVSVHMTCGNPRCQHEFCWLSLQDWTSSSHDASFCTGSAENFEEENRQLHDAILIQTSSHVQERDDARQQGLDLDVEIIELSRTLEAKILQRSELQMMVDSCEIRLASIKSKFEKQLRRLDCKMNRLEETRRDLDQDVKQLEPVVVKLDQAQKMCAESTTCRDRQVAAMQQELERLQRVRGKAEVLMGKNTMIRKGLQIGHNEYPDAGVDKLRAYMKGNLGFILATNCILDEIRDVLAENRRWQGAKAGKISNVGLVLPSGPTGMEPSQTSFFQLLSIGTKIVKDQIELTSDFPLLKVGSKVSSSVQALLQKLGLKPFNFGMEVHGVFQDGAVFDAAVLDIKSDVLVTKFMAMIANVAAFGQEVGIPSEAGMPQMFANGFKMLLRLFLTSTTSPAKVGLKNAVILAIAIGIF